MFFLRVLSLLSVEKQVVSSKNAQRFGDCNGVVHLYIQNRSHFILNPFISPQFVDSHKNGTFCTSYSCRDLIFKLLLVFFTAKKVAHHPKIVRGA